MSPVTSFRQQLGTPRAARCAIALAPILLVWLASSLSALGSEAADAGPDPLARALEAARKELAQERERVAREEEARGTRVRELETKRKQLSDAVVDLELDVAGLRERSTGLRTELEALAQTAPKRQADREKLPRVLDESLSRLEGHVKSLTPSADREAQLDTVSALRDQLDENGVTPEAFARLVQLLGDLLVESRTGDTYDSTVRTSDGKQAPATILRLGHVACAYVTTDGRAEVALRAPDGEGLRWSERSTDTTRDAIQSAVRLVESKAAGTCPFPVDVTRTLAKQRRYGKEELWERFSAGGAVMIPLAAVALIALVLIVERFWFFSREGRASERHAASVLGRCAQGDLPAARAYCESNRGPVVRALHACLTHLEEGVVAMEDGVQETLLHELPRLERFFSTLSILATVAPLLGLLGTVTGMIHTFDMITVHGTGEPRLMAGGISEALTTTATGLVIAIPILLIHSVLSGKMEKVIADTERFAASLLILLRDQHLIPEGGNADEPS